MNIEVTPAVSDEALFRELLNGDPAAACLADVFENSGSSLFAVYLDGVLVGGAEMESGKSSYLKLYTAPKYRRRGIADRAADILERRLIDGGAERIYTSFAYGEPAAAKFIGRRGYGERYASTRMEYRGQPFELDQLPIRGYIDGDYPAAHDLYARAFHEMRVATGAFPNSVVEPESDAMRRAWADTAGERFVYVLDGAPVGYAHIDGGELSSISVEPKLQGRGIGRGFVKHCCNLILKEHPTVTLYCVVGNPARRLYDSLGFMALSIDEYALKRI